LASLKSQQDDVGGVRTFFQMAMPFYEKGGYRKELFALYVILGRAETKAGEYDAAQHRFEELLHRAQEAADPQSTAWAQEGLGRVFMLRRNFPEALSHYNANYEIVKSINAKLNMGYAANNRAESLWQLGRYQEAQSALAEALAIAEPQGREAFKDLQADIHLTKARMTLSMGKSAEAMAEAQQALDIGAGQSKSTIVEVGYISGLAQSRAGRTPDGRKRCEEALKTARELGDPLLLSNALLAFAESALLAGDAQTAIGAASEAQQRFSASKQYESEWRACLLQARANEKLGDKVRAHDLAQQAAAIGAQLQAEWTNDNYKSYLTRHDVTELQKLIGSP